MLEPLRAPQSQNSRREGLISPNFSRIKRLVVLANYLGSLDGEGKEAPTSGRSLQKGCQSWEG